MPTTDSVTAMKKRTVRGGIALPTGQEIYDRIMKTIEPELVLSNLKKLDVPYKKETPAKRKARYARYTKAFKEYRIQYKAWITKLNLALQAYKRVVIKSSERKTLTDEQSLLAALESQMSSL